MKTKILLALMVGMLTGILFIGCSTPNSRPDRVADQASTAIHVTVIAALHGWDAYLNTKDIELYQMSTTNAIRSLAERQKIANQSLRVRDAYNKYRMSQLALLSAAEAYAVFAGDGSTNSLPVQDRLGQATQASTQALSDVLSLLTSFGVKF